MSTAWVGGEFTAVVVVRTAGTPKLSAAEVNDRAGMVPTFAFCA